jgi:hypothetical protein
MPKNLYSMARWGDNPFMYRIDVQKAPGGYDIFKDGNLVTTVKDEWSLELQLNSYGILEGICRDFLRRVRDTGKATEEILVTKIRQVS